MADRGEDEQRYGVEQEDRSHGNTNFFLVRAGDRGDGGDRTSPADGGARGNQERCLSCDLEQAAKEQAKQHGSADAKRGVNKTGAAGVHHLLQIHAESQGHDGGLQQMLG